jgi:CxxC motif-containing protein
MEERKMICISCPIGCRLTVTEENGEYVITGNQCKRGEVYGKKEMTNPTRVVPTTVKIRGARLRRLPVKTHIPLAKPLIFEAMKLINEVEVEAPVKVGDVVIENILDTGVNIVATRSMERTE